MKILWAEPSLDDLRAIRDYIGKDSETCAVNFIESIVSAVGQLSEFPRMGRIVAEAGSPDIRELVFRGYRVIYPVHESVIHILAVIHGYRDLSGMSPKPWEA